MIPLKDSALDISWWRYLLFAMALSVVIRAILTFFKCYRIVYEDGGGVRAFMRYFVRILCGVGHKDITSETCRDDQEKIRGDYGMSYVLGVLELTAFPFLFSAGLYAYVGAWIGLKVVAQYKIWTKDRGSFTQFLIGNALVLILAFACLRGHVCYSYNT